MFYGTLIGLNGADSVIPTFTYFSIFYWFVFANHRKFLPANNSELK